MTAAATHQPPPHTVDDLMNATRKTRRVILELLRQYSAATGTDLPRIPKRNFLEIRIPDDVFQQIVEVVQRAETDGFNYSELFRELSQNHKNEGGTPSPAGTTDLSQLQAQLNELLTLAREQAEQIRALSEQVSTMQTTLDAALTPAE